MHTHETLCSHITTTLVLQRAQDWYAFDTSLLYSVYMCYIWLCMVVLLYHLWLHRALSICGQAYFDITSQGLQVTALANLTNLKYTLQWRASMSCSTSSQMYGSWYCMFLLRERSLTLMTMASSMALVTIWDSLSMVEKLQFDGKTCGVDMVLVRGGALNVPCTCSQRSFLSHQCIPLCILDGHICTCILTFLCW